MANDSIPESRTYSHSLLVGVGFSARDHAVLQEFFARIGAGSGVAFFLAPARGTAGDAALIERLRSAGTLAISPASDGAPIEADHVYVLPGSPLFEIRDLALHMSPEKDAEPPRSQIDALLSSLADAGGSLTVGILMPHVDPEGAVGLRAVSERGGLTIAVKAGDDSVEAASVAGLVDHVLPAEAVALELREHLRHLEGRRGKEAEEALRLDVAEHIPAVCNTLKLATGHNFKHYRTSTLSRRIQRRMQVLRIANAGEYLQRLSADRGETDALFRELLIGVTSFFRDPEAFEALSTRVIQDLVAHCSAEGVRVWVPGCATGEEAYSLAILFAEQMERAARQVKVQIFATDIDEAALQTARSGLYPAAIAGQLSQKRLAKFFIKRRKQFLVSPELRKMCLFSPHNVISDPPFARMDLITCRNVLIYFGPHLQKKLLALFHFAVRPGGYLFLGPSESMTSHAELFRPIDVKHRISQRKFTATDARPLLSEPPGNWTPIQLGRGSAPGADVGGLAQRIVLEEFAPAFAVVNEQSQVVYLSARTERYLRPGAGPFENSIVKMARSGLGVALRSALHDAIKSQRQIIHNRASVRSNGKLRPVKITVQPMPAIGDESGLLMVVFEDLPDLSEQARTGVRTDKATERVIEELEREISNTREDLERAVQELETTNQEIKSSNEELRSMNEELQSANEELETSKEEIQTALEALGRAHTDLENLLSSTRIATIFLDEREQIQRFTPAAAEIYNLIPSDVGRPIGDITHNAESMPPLPKASAVAPRTGPIEHEIRIGDGRRFMRRVLPYRDRDGQVTGLVVTFIDTTELRTSEENAHQRLAEIRTVYDAAPIGLCVLDRELRLVRLNERFAEISGLEGAGYEGRRLREVMPVLAEKLESKLGRLVRTGRPIADMELTLDPHDAGQGRRSWLVRGDPLRSADGKIVGVNLMALETTARRRTERRLAAEHAVSRILAGAADFETAAPGVLEALCRELEMEAGELWLTDPAGRQLTCSHDHIAEPLVAPLVEAGRRLRIGPGEGLPGCTWKTRQPLWINDLIAHEGFARGDEARRTGVQTGACFPILTDQDCVGVICVFLRAVLPPDSGTLDTFAAIGRSIGQFVQRTNAEKAEKRQAQVLATINRVNTSLVAELDLEPLVQSVTDAGTELTGAQFGAFFYNVVDENNQKYMLHTISGVPIERFSSFPMPRNTELFAATFTGLGPVRIDDVLQDPRYGKNEPYFGMPPGNLPVRSYLAVPVVSRNGEVAGGLFFGHEEVGRFTEEHEAILVGIAAQAAIAIENARLYADRSRLAVIVDTSQDAIMAKTLTGEITSWNDSAAKMFGYTAEEAVGQNISLIVPEDRREEIAEILERAAAGEAILGMETERVTKDGRRIAILLTISPLRDRQGRPAGASVIARDITERKRAEQQLAESQRELKDFVDNATVGLHWVGPDGTILWANRAELELLGYSAEEYVGRNIAEFHTDPTAINDILSRLCGGEQVDAYEAALRHKDGSIRHVSVSSSVYWRDGQFIHTRGFSRDITGQKQFEEALRSSEAEHRLTLEAALDCVVVMDDEGVIVGFNAAAERTFGHSRDQAIGRPLAELLIPSRYREQHWRGLKRFLETGRSSILNRRIEMPGLRADGTEFPAELTVTAILPHSQFGRRLFTAFLRDVTEQKRTEELLATRFRQQSALADFGQRALYERELQPVLDDAVGTISGTLGTKLSNVLALLPDRREFLLRAGVGWSEGLVGTARVPAGSKSQAGHTLLRDDPVVVDDLRKEARFTAPRLLKEHGAVSGISCVLRGERGEKWGVLAAHSDAPRRFTIEDVAFLVGVANVVSGAIQRAEYELAIRESEERFRKMADNVPVLIWMSDAGKRTIYVNRQWLDFTGRTLEQELGDGWMKSIHPEDVGDLDVYRRAFERREAFSTSFRMRRADGEFRWLYDTGVPRFAATGEFLGFIGSCIDVTEQRQAQETRARLAAIVESSDDAMVSKDLSGVIQSWNAGAERLFGYAAAEAVGRHITLIIPPERHGEEETILARMRRGERIEHYQTERVAKDGRRLHVALTVSPLRDESGRIIGVSKVGRDITRAKQAEQALREYAGRLEAILETAVDGIITIDERGAIESANPAALQVFGYRPDEIVGRNVNMLMPEPYHSEHDTYLGNYLRTGERKIIGIGREVLGRRKDGSTFPMELAVSETRLGEGRIFTGLVRDLTERKRAQEALLESEARLRFTLESARVGTWEWDIGSGRVEWSDNLEGIHQMQPGAFDGTMDGVIRDVHPSDREALQAAIQRALANGGEFQAEYRVATDREDGPAWVEGRGRVFLDEGGKPIRMAGICADVTDRKRAEQALAVLAAAGGTLATSLDYQETLTKVANLIVPTLADWCVIDVTDEHGDLREVAIAHADPRMIEYARELRRRYPPDPAAQFGVANVMRTGKPEVFTDIPDEVLRLSAKDPEHLEILRKLNLRSGIVVPLLARGRTIGAMTLITDRSARRFTEQHLALLEEFARSCALAIDNARLYRESQRELADRIRAEAALRASDERLRLALIGGGMGAWEWNLDNNESIWDAKMRELLGFDPASPQQATRQFLEHIHPDDRDRVERQMREAIDKSGQFNEEFRFVRGDGRVRWLAGIGSVVKDAEGTVARLIGINYDVTDRKEAEESVRDSEERLRLAVTNAPLLLCHCDADLRFTWFAKGPQADFPAEQIVGRTAEELIGREGRPLMELQRRALSSGAGVRGEVTLDSATDRRTWDVAVEPLKDARGQITGLTLAALDITERKMAEDRQQMLLAELSHRVKNTLATVQSIATQTILQCDDPARFRESFQARLHSLAHTHSLLVRGQWRGADLRAIVAGELSPHTAAGSDRVRISGPRLFLSPKAALSLHLVLHELATNAAKYGALSSPAGVVEVHWELLEKPSPQLRLTWTETGGPPVSSPQRRGFGSIVIEKSVDYELEGTTNVEYREEGLTCEFLIPWSETIGFT